MRTKLRTRNVAMLGVLGLVACTGTVGEGGPNPATSSGSVAGSTSRSSTRYRPPRALSRRRSA
jgi:hypothetical protein